MYNEAPFFLFSLLVNARRGSKEKENKLYEEKENEDKNE